MPRAQVSHQPRPGVVVVGRGREPARSRRSPARTRSRPARPRRRPPRGRSAPARRRSTPSSRGRYPCASNHATIWSTVSADGPMIGSPGGVQRADHPGPLERGVGLGDPLLDRGLLLLEVGEQAVERGLLLLEVVLLACAALACVAARVVRASSSFTRVVVVAARRRRRRAACGARRRARCRRRCRWRSAPSPPIEYSATARWRRWSRSVSRSCASAARCCSSAAMWVWSLGDLRLRPRRAARWWPRASPRLRAPPPAPPRARRGP